jgi:hypothetical protein
MKFDLELAPLNEFKGDLLVGVIGYERRSAFVAQNHAKCFRSKLYLSYESHGCLSFEENYKYFSESGFTISSDLSFSGIRKAINSATSNRSPSNRLSIGVDISSMSKPVLGHVVKCIFERMEKEKIEVQFMYAPAVFTPPTKEQSTSLAFHLLEGFEGWTQFPEKPLAAILGLGYEQDQALGALEYLDPNAAWAFLPIGHDRRYEKEVLRTNDNLIEYLQTHRVLRYLVEDPIAAFKDLRIIVESVLTSSRVDLIPGGPKIFGLLCMIVRMAFGPEVSVWRISSHDNQDKIDREADKRVVAFVVHN